MENNLKFNNMMIKYPNRVPVIIEDSDTIILKHYKYLVPKNISISQFIYIIRTNMNIGEKQAIFIFVKSDEEYILLNLNESMENTYNAYKQPDNFLYIKFKIENTFGGF